MKAATFDYVRATDVQHAVRLLAEGDGDAKVLAGGQSLVPLLAMRLAQPTVLVDLAAIPELAAIRDDGDHITIGAMARHRDVETSPLLGAVPLLPKALRHVGHVTIRNRGTIGGSTAHADPAAEIPSVLRALDATIVAEGPAGRRSIPAASFFHGFLQTALEPDELLVEIHVPKQRPGTVVEVREFARRNGDFALAAVFTAVCYNRDGTLAEARIAAAGVGQVPVRATAAEEILLGAVPTADTVAAAADAVAAATDPISDIHAPAEFRRHLAAVLTRRCLAPATERNPA